ncbi:MAG: 2-oxo acid dehydrogenase subunit E2 [Pseudonocardiaceae bacterium]|nr:2-oxo acid dehydrogenase subunit E2 [Pseudonocardiaceae bacterium]
MSQYKQFPLPDVGEGLTEAEILSWRVAPGDTVSVNQIIVEIETAKAAVELPCPYAGVVTELLAEPGATVSVGSPIVTIDLDPDSAAPSQTGSDEQVPNLVGYGPKSATATRRPRKATTEPAPEPAIPPAPEPAAAAAPAAERAPLAKPPVRKLAKDLGIDLGRLAGSGHDGIITREDVQHAHAVSNGAPPAAAPREGERRVPVRGVRRATAQAVVASAFSAPHVTEFLTVDVSPMMALRDKLGSQRGFRDVKLTPLAFASKAVCLAVRRTPDVNASWDEAAGEIVYFDHVNLGIAAATPRGLVVPKIRRADAMPLAELAGALEALATTAREGATAPEDMVGGTFTITNVGVFGVDTGTPILNPGESAILALGAIREMPWVVDGAVVPRPVCQLALSFDHRVVDGQQGSQFLADVGALLADPAIAITF